MTTATTAAPPKGRDYFNSGGAALRAWAKAGDEGAESELRRRASKKASKADGSASVRAASPRRTAKRQAVPA